MVTISYVQIISRRSIKASIGVTGLVREVIKAKRKVSGVINDTE